MSETPTATTATSTQIPFEILDQCSPLLSRLSSKLAVLEGCLANKTELSEQIIADFFEDMNDNVDAINSVFVE